MIYSNERQTRKNLIDQALCASGWAPVIPFQNPIQVNCAAVEEYPTTNGPSDYVLFSSGRPIAIVEAKKLAVGPQNVLQQAQRYAQGIQKTPFSYNGFHIPFIYSTNGEVIWFQDLRRPNSRSRRLAAFHTPAALEEMLTRELNSAESYLRDMPVDHPWLRPYQKDAIVAIEQAILTGKRAMLVAMATGTGKTLTTIDLIYRLMKSGTARRILFLVDRRALAAQAVTAFANFEAEPGLKFDRIYEVYSQRFRPEDLEDEKFDPKVLPTSYLTNPDLSHAFVYVSTIQRMRINLFGAPDDTPWVEDVEAELDASRLDIPIHAFDLIIADECHRGYTTSEESKWREVLDHFDGIKVGLTATPAAHTTAYFKDIVYRYEYERAVREGYLVDYDPIVVRSEVSLNGAFLRPGEEVGLQDSATGQLHFEFLEDQRELLAPEIDQQWAAPDRDRRIVQEVAKYLLEQETELHHFPKTLFFAHNDLPHVSHADRLVNLLRDEFGRGDAFVKKITGNPNVDRPLQRIREFRNRPEPGIVVTVDMLSTGVDIPALENIVLLRPVKSRILFEQIMGRGTRLCPEINKTKFTVFDCVGALDYFAKATAFTAEPPTKPSRTLAQVIDDIYGNRDREYNTRILVNRLQRIAKSVSADGRKECAQWIPNGDISAFAAGLPAELESRWAETTATLRNPEFQHWLEHYPRARSYFIIAESVTDQVESGYLIRTRDGKAVRPEDYLRAFETFVRENPEHVEAIAILLDRPDGWSTRALGELRQKLESRPEGFTEQKLRQAYNFALADIISLVKHAGEGDPLVSAEERVDRALERITANKVLTMEQEKWLDLIRAHLIENLAIDREDFNLLTFTRAGANWARVNRDFGGRLEDWLAEINRAIAE
jgi:type I restriction enzyme R subunit